MEKFLKKEGLLNNTEFRVGIGKEEFPVMKAQHNLEKDEWLVGEDAIYSYLMAQKMIISLTHRSNSAWALLGCE
jgi:hypothetical protein